MLKILLIVAVFALVYFVMRAYARSLAPKPPASSAAAEDMVRCRHCGLHLPRTEGIAAGQHFYCCEEHRRLNER